VRPFLHRQGVAVGAFIAAGALLGLATVLSVVASALGRMTETVAGLPVAPALIALADSLPFLLSIGVFLLVYKFIPPVDVPWRVAFVLGAGVAGAWELLRRVFTVFISSSGIYRDLYGPLSSLMLLLVWVYASATIILYGAELGAAWQRELALADEAKRDPYLPGMRVAAE
jgi:membrane protein